MATGIVATAMQTQGFVAVAWVMFVLNLGAYAALWIAGLARIARSTRAVAAEIADHARGPAFLTAVAATAVLGVQCSELAGFRAAAAALWVLSLLLWFVLCYTFLAAVTLAEAKPRLDEGLDGTWLLATVSIESVAVLGTTVAGSFPRADIVVFASLVLFMAGAMVYIIIIGLIFFRWIFRPMDAHTITPTYWINMGAVAITTLAGAGLVDAAPRHPFVAGIEHFLAGFTLFFWAAGTWWIPLLAVLFAWRHLLGRTPLRYDVQYWSLVFPLGMYSVATHAYAQANRLDFLLPLARVAGYVAMAAWALTAIGFARRLAALISRK